MCSTSDLTIIRSLSTSSLDTSPLPQTASSLIPILLIHTPSIVLASSAFGKSTLITGINIDALDSQTDCAHVSPSLGLEMRMYTGLLKFETCCFSLCFNDSRVTLWGRWSRWSIDQGIVLDRPQFRIHLSLTSAAARLPYSTAEVAVISTTDTSFYRISDSWPGCYMGNTYEM